MKYTLSVTDIWEGGKRPYQEDSMYPAKGESTPDDRLFLVCDGMGGHDDGDKASAAVCRAMSTSILRAQPDSEGSFSQTLLQQAVDDAFLALDEADTHAKKKMGTTMTCLKLFSGGAMVAHMGDSRVYHIRSGSTVEDTKIMWVTRDHSLVNDLIAIGELTPEQARHSRQRNVITRAMQPNMDRRPRADFHLITDIQPGDYFFLCSDGMLEQIDDDQLRFYFSGEIASDEDRTKKLIDATADNHDNHTAILVHILGVEQTPDEEEPVEEVEIIANTLQPNPTIPLTAPSSPGDDDEKTQMPEAAPVNKSFAERTLNPLYSAQPPAEEATVPPQWQATQSAEVAPPQPPRKMVEEARQQAKAQEAAPLPPTSRQPRGPQKFDSEGTVRPTQVPRGKVEPTKQTKIPKEKSLDQRTIIFVAVALAVIVVIGLIIWFWQSGTTISFGKLLESMPGK